MKNSVLLLSGILFFLLASPIVLACDCQNWLDMGCTNETHRSYIRTCDPSGCDVQSYTTADTGCTTPPETSTFLNKYVITIIIVLTISASFSLYVGGENILITFGTCSGILFFLLTVGGLFPQWVIWVVLGGVSLLFAKLIIDFING